MFAIIKSSGRQFKIEENHTIDINVIDAAVDSEIELKDIVLISKDSEIIDHTNAKITARVLQHFRGEKVIIFKKRRRKHYRRKRGYRHDMTKLLITKISV
jgi:large subunit ribosomal protein L21